MAVKKATAATAVKEKPMSKYMQLRAEALAESGYVEPEPYVFDGCNPPVLISAPNGLERTLNLATLMDNLGQVEIEDMKPMLENLFGEEAFPAVWNVIRKDPIEVTLALVEDIHDHFLGDTDDLAGDLPGGE